MRCRQFSPDLDGVGVPGGHAVNDRVFDDRVQVGGGAELFFVVVRCQPLSRLRLAQVFQQN